MQQHRIYLDHAATTPVLWEVREAMADALSRWHNPSSPHAEGRAAKAALEDARARIASALAWNGKIIFTSGASEALAIALGRGKGGKRFVSAIEHDAVFRAAKDAVRLPIGGDGNVSLDAVEGERPIAAIQHANNETGIVQPLEKMAEQLNDLGGILVADCAQTAGKLPLPPADMIALSAHKFGGPPGVGALLVRDYALIEPMGGQEQGYRSGTENLPGIIGMAVALEAGNAWLKMARRYRAQLEQNILSAGGEVIGGKANRISTIGAYRMPGVPSAVQLIQFDTAGFAVSAGSACSSGSLKPSHVLEALGLDSDAGREIIRVSFGRSTTQAEVDSFASAWADIAAKRRAA